MTSHFGESYLNRRCIKRNAAGRRSSEYPFHWTEVRLWLAKESPNKVKKWENDEAISSRMMALCCLQIVTIARLIHHLHPTFRNGSIPSRCLRLLLNSHAAVSET
ncbi:hypothetical protein Trydic_g5585 [Trypoxylus dichotomus]